MDKSNVDYKIGEPDSFSSNEKSIFLNLLIKQNKVLNPTIEKIDRCKFLGTASFEGKAVAIGAIKPKTSSDFQEPKANLPDLSDHYRWEIGYFYTLPKYEGNHISTAIFNSLMQKYGAGNLMATTEIREENRMVNMLLNRGFKKAGKTWVSIKSGMPIQLFLSELIQKKP